MEDLNFDVEPADERAGESSMVESAKRVSKQVTDALVSAFMVMSPIVAVIIGAVTFGFAWNIVYGLFYRYLGQNQPAFVLPIIGAINGAHLAAASSVAMFFVMLGVTKFSTHNSIRAAAGLLSVVYLVITLFLGSVRLLFDASSGSSKQLKALADTFFKAVPFMSDLGAVAVAVLMGLAIAGWGLIIHTSKMPPDHFESENKARAHFLGNTFKIIVSLASIGFSVTFGSEILGMPATLAVLGGLILDFAFLTALQKSESAAAVQDFGEARKWRNWMLVYLAAIAFMGVETMSELSKRSGKLPVYAMDILNSPVFHLIQVVGLLAMITAIGLALVMIGFTSSGNKPADEDSEGGFSLFKPNTWSLPTLVRQRETVAALPNGTAVNPNKHGPQLDPVLLAEDRAGVDPAPSLVESPSATAIKRRATWNTIGRYTFEFNGEDNYDDGEPIEVNGSPIGEIGMKAEYNNVGANDLRLWLFDKGVFTSAQTYVPLTRKTFDVQIGSLAAECYVERLTCKANGAIAHAWIVADVLSANSKVPAEGSPAPK